MPSTRRTRKAATDLDTDQPDQPLSDQDAEPTAVAPQTDPAETAFREHYYGADRDTQPTDVQPTDVRPTGPQDASPPEKPFTVAIPTADDPRPQRPGGLRGLLRPRGGTTADPLTADIQGASGPSYGAPIVTADEPPLAARADVALSVREDLFGRTTAAQLAADSISAWFGDHKVLDRVSLTMRAGEVTALIGPSGCGKSTFLRILNRMHEMIPTASLAGEVRLDEQDIYAPSERVTAARRQIGMIFQKPNPFPAMSIYENVVAGLKLSGVRATRDQKDVLVEDSLRKAALWDEVKDRLEQPGGGLSGGQQQRLCIARSLAVSPRVLLMDEPCSALDPTSTRRVEETIESLRGQVTVVIVTHNMQQAHRISDECALFLATQNTPGVIVEHGDTSAMFDRPQDQRTSDYVQGKFG